MATSNTLPSAASCWTGTEHEDPFAPYIGRTVVSFGKTLQTNNHDDYTFSSQSNATLDLRISKRDLVIMFWFMENHEDICEAIGVDVPDKDFGLDGMMRHRGNFVERYTILVNRPKTNVMQLSMPLEHFDGVLLAQAVQKIDIGVSPEDWFKMLRYCSAAGAIAKYRPFRKIIRNKNPIEAQKRSILEGWLSWCSNIQQAGTTFDKALNYAERNAPVFKAGSSLSPEDAYNFDAEPGVRTRIEMMFRK